MEDAVKEGFRAERIVAVTGAYHVAGLTGEEPSMTDKEMGLLPSVPCNVTLMPYSYYRLSSRSGYGAGNEAPAYYGMLWLTKQPTANVSCRHCRKAAGIWGLTLISQPYPLTRGSMVFLCPPLR